MPQLIPPSLGDILAIKKERTNAGRESIDLLIGDPDHKPPEVLLKAYEEALRDGRFHGYSDQQGRLETRVAIAEALKKEGIHVGPENLFISGGSKSIANAIIQMNVEPGDKVSILSPFYLPYLNQVILAKGAAEIVGSEAAMVDRVRDRNVSTAIVVTPNNPDGKIYNTQFFLRTLVRVAEQNGVLVVVDEAYKDFWYSAPFQSIAADMDFKRDKNVVVVRTFSKSYGVCGWRLGYAIGHEEAIRNLKLYQSASINPPSTLAQVAFENALPSINSGYLEANREKYRTRLDIATDTLSESGILAAMPDGAFYIFLNLSDHIGPGRKYENSKAFSRALAQQTGVLTWPGADYGNDGAVRLSLASITDRNLAIAPEKIASFLKQ